MSEHLGDLGQGDPAVEQLGGEGVAEAVGSYGRNPSPDALPPHHLAHGCGPHWPRRRGNGQEQDAGFDPGASLDQVRTQGFSDVGRYRQAVLAPGFAVDHHLGCSPVQIVELESRDLRSPQTESGEHDQHGEVAYSRWCCPVAAVNQSLDVRGREAFGHGGVFPARNRRHRLRQGRVGQPLQVEKPQQRAQFSDAALKRARREAP